jgi:hypothetical protein
MTISITHPFVSAKGDGTDATLVRPSNWNAVHTTSMANNTLVGNVSGGIGPFTEIALSPFVAAALGAVDAASFLAALGVGAFLTGDVKFTLNTNAEAGWIIYQGGGVTIGNAISSASVRANADCQALYVLIWTIISSQSANLYCPVLGGLGASAISDFNANKQITLPWFSGRTIVGAGASAGLLSTRSAGAWFGEETHALVAGEVPNLTSTGSISGSANVTPSTGGNFVVTGGSMIGGATGNVTGGSLFAFFANAAPIISGATGSVTGSASVATNTTGGTSPAHNNMQPSIPLWVKVKL